MAQPSPYVPNTTFVSYQAQQPWFPGQQLDAEFNNLDAIIGEIEANLALIQRDDGALANGSVTYDSLSLGLQTAGLAPLTTWAAGVNYVVPQAIIINSTLYQCAVANTSSNFTDDLAAGYWTFISDLSVIESFAPTASANTFYSGPASGSATAAAFRALAFVDLPSFGGSPLGTSYKTPVAVATTANITLSGEQTIDGVLTSASRVLVKNQSTGSQNGIYVSASGAWARTNDFSTTGQAVRGTQVLVNQGTANGGKSFAITTANPITIGTTALTFFAASASSGGSLVYNPQDYGWLPDGTDRSTQAQALINLVIANGGGSIFFPASTSKYRADSQLSIPASTIPGDGFNGQASLRLTGPGGAASVSLANVTGPGNAATLDLRYQGIVAGAGTSGTQANKVIAAGSGFSDGVHTLTLVGGDYTTQATFNVTFAGGVAASVPTLVNPGLYATIPANPIATTGGDGTGVTLQISFNGAKIISLHDGSLEIDHLSLVDGSGSNSTPFVQANATSLCVHNCNIDGSGDSQQKGFVLGGTKLSGALVPQTLDSPYTGYGPTLFDNNSFLNLDAGICLRGWTNDVVINNNSFQNCTGKRFIQILGAGSAGAIGCTISNNLFEIVHAPYGIEMSGASQNLFINNAFWDPSTGHLLDFHIIDSGSTGNTFILGHHDDGTKIFGGNANALTECTVITSDLGITSALGTGIYGSQFAGNLDIHGTYDITKKSAGQINLCRQGLPSAGRFTLAFDSTAGGVLDARDGAGGILPIDVQPGGGSTNFHGAILSTPALFAALPAASTCEGAMRAVTDSTTNSWGATITGTGAFHVLAYSNGTNWTVMAK